MRFLFSVFLFLFGAGAAAGCFGPKLYLGCGGTAEEELLFALVSLYVQEKTGTEIVRVPLDGREPLAELRAEQVDLAFVPDDDPDVPAVLAIPGWPRLISGRRPLADLQFTTVGPALEKLDRLLTVSHLEKSRRQVAAGRSPAAAARQLLSEERWI